MAESSKYDFFMDELASLEKQIYFFVQKSIEFYEINAALEKKIKQLENENEVLRLKIDEEGTNFNDNSLLISDEGLFGKNLLSNEERAALKRKISELISKLDYHLRS